MKRIVAIFTAVFVALFALLPAAATDGKVIYDGSSRDFIFEPGSSESPTDLFPNFKNVMPGDSLTQQITVKNDASKNVKVKLYLRSLGAVGDSDEFLSKLGLKVSLGSDNEMGYMFDAAASESAALTDWVCLGTLYSGGEVNLDVTLSVPIELSNEYQGKTGYIDWEFMIEEFPVEPGDPQAPQTGDESHTMLWCMLALLALIMLVISAIARRKDRESENH